MVCPRIRQPNDPYVWVFSKDGTEVRRRAPRNLFRESNMYAFEDRNGRLNQAIENRLSVLEDRFKRLRRDKIMSGEPLTEEERGLLCVFIATAQFRTRRSRNHWARQFGQTVELADRIKAHAESLTSDERAALGPAAIPDQAPSFDVEDTRALADQPFRMLPSVATRVATMLYSMTITILYASEESVFITSDNPVVLYDPELHRMPRFYRSVALASPTIEVSMPIAPSRLVLLMHGRLKEGYIRIPADHAYMAEEFNRRTRFHCDSQFVSNSDRKKDIWFDPGSPDGSSSG
jgi:Protein of unknown function (DUF4238)